MNHCSCLIYYYYLYYKLIHKDGINFAKYFFHIFGDISRLNRRELRMKFFSTLLICLCVFLFLVTALIPTNFDLQNSRDATFAENSGGGNKGDPLELPPNPPPPPGLA